MVWPKEVYTSVTSISHIYSTVSFAQVSLAARQLTMATADSPGPGRQIKSNIPAARWPTIE